jgi:putative (di)nucleoside polyphosphate hydrolase
VIDQEGFRANVGIILTNGSGGVFWARRAGQDSWQFPQGGIDAGETAAEAMYRELKEEVGLTEDDVSIVAQTPDWLRYRLPKRMIRRNNAPRCIGQKQIWFLLQMNTGSENNVRFDVSDSPEFDGWKWVDMWQPLRDVVFFKREVYRRAIRQFAPAVYPDGVPEPLRSNLRSPLCGPGQRLRRG